MSKYYCLIAGLPSIALDDNKSPFSVLEFREELDGVLSSSDKKLTDLLFYKFDNRNLLSFINGSDKLVDERGQIPWLDYEQVFKAIRDEEKISFKHALLPYMVDFLREYVEAEAKEEKVVISWEDRLSALYYSYAMKCHNSFVAQWFELNLNINNVLIAITCRKHQLDKNLYIVGNNNVAEILRVSNSRDFGLTDEMDCIGDLLHIAEEPDLMDREKKIDLLKWKWLEEQTFFKTFDIESVYAYLLRLEMMERWTTLDKKTGEKTFREIVGTMKKGSINALDEFKRNNNK